MKNMKLITILLLFFSISQGCQNGSKNKIDHSEKDNNIISDLINRNYNTVDCSEFGDDYKPYFCLGLDSMSLSEVRAIYGKEKNISIDTLVWGRCKTCTYEVYDKDPDLGECLSKVSFAIVTYCHWVLSDGKEMQLFFIKSLGRDILFGGYKYNPEYYMLE